MSFFSRLFGRKDKPAAGPPPPAPAVVPAPAPVADVPEPVAAPVPAPPAEDLAGALSDRVGARWPGLVFDHVPALAELAAEWAASGGIDEDTLDRFGARAAEVAMHWSPEPRFLRTLSAGETVDAVMDRVPADVAPTRAAFGVARGEGALVYAVIAFAVP